MSDAKSDYNIGHRYLNLAITCIGEATAEIGNVRNRNGVPGPDFANAKLALMRAISALEGVPYVASVGIAEGGHGE